MRLLQRSYDLKPGLRAALLFAITLTAASALAADQPGDGIEVQPLKSSIAEETFQTLLVMKALEELGYEVEDIKEIEYAAGHIAVANGDATFMADHWNPLHIDFYKEAGGDQKLYREGTYSEGALQGYLIDKATADQYDITNIAQFKNPEIAELFDTDGDGKADLAGCTPGWGCEKVIEHHLDAYGCESTSTTIRAAIRRSWQIPSLATIRASRSSITPGCPTGSAVCWCRART